MFYSILPLKIILELTVFAELLFGCEYYFKKIVPFYSKLKVQSWTRPDLNRFQDWSHSFEVKRRQCLKRNQSYIKIRFLMNKIILHN
jgi:hypothetical protein